jgi:hypothetical protein
MAERFIEIPSALYGPRTIAISQISSVQPYMMGTKIILKEIKDGANVEVTTSANYNDVIRLINSQSE